MNFVITNQDAVEEANLVGFLEADLIQHQALKLTIRVQTSIQAKLNEIKARLFQFHPDSVNWDPYRGVLRAHDDELLRLNRQFRTAGPSQRLLHEMETELKELEEVERQFFLVL